MKSKPFYIYLAVAVATFCLGVCLAAIWYFNTSTLPQQQLQTETLAAEELLQTKITFRLLSNADGIIKDEVFFASQSYESSMGEKVFYQQEGYSLPERARQVFQERLNKPNVKVLERNENYGLENAERAVLVETENSISRASIIIIDRKGIDTISSQFLRVALAFEKTNVKRR